MVHSLSVRIRTKRITQHPTPAMTIAHVFNIFLISWIVLFTTYGKGHAGEQFPRYPSIEKNVLFWKKVYSEYTTIQGIFHDIDDLSIIYGAVDLAKWDSPGAARINRNIIKLARDRYTGILKKLATGSRPQNAEEARIAALFPSRSRLAYDKARNNIRLQIGQKDRFLEGVIRSGATMQSIRDIFKSYGLPQELAYLPHVESSFNNEAHSHAGAVGLWQFTKSTGKEYLTINDELDERFDIQLASHAAARFLKENHEKLGTWPLALTAYNYGQAGMLRAVKQKKDYESIFKSYKAGYFKFASRNFYSEFLAALQVASKLEKDPSIIRDRPEAIITIPMTGYASARQMMDFFRISEQDFERLNPALRAPVLKGNKYIPKDYRLKIPGTRNTRTLAGKIPAHYYHSSQIPDTVYIVRKGDTVGAIAAKYKITVKELSRLNQLDGKATIRIGQKLKIPQKNRPADVTVLKDNSKRKRM